MLGSGIFVLPGLAAAKTGPSIWLAYLVAGLCVVPAALSKAELEYIRSDPAESTAKVPWVTLLPHRQTWAFILGKFMTDPIWWFYLYWLPKFLNELHPLFRERLIGRVFFLPGCVTVQPK